MPLHPALPRITDWLNTRLGRASVLCYTAAFLVPEAGNVVRHNPLNLHGIRIGAPTALLITILFAAAYRVSLREMAVSLRRPRVLVAGLAAHLATPFMLAPAAAAVLALTGTTESAAFVPTALALVTTAPVAAGATVWVSRGTGDASVMISIIVLSALLSPLTLPTTFGVLDHTGAFGTHPLFSSAGTPGSTRDLLTVTVALPCAAGLLCRRLSHPRVRAWADGLSRLVAMLGVLALTYVNASAAAPLVRVASVPSLLAAVMSACAACLLAFQIGRWTARWGRLPREAAATVTLACGMNNVSVSSVLAVTAVSTEPGLLVTALAYGLVQKVAAHRAMAGHEQSHPVPTTAQATGDPGPSRDAGVPKRPFPL
ncbi:bile acid:sodium symporter family protein [Streptomyces misionensis]|uniref:bile acid:sodium symporter family protein n=1 Tax=Streptomyces misionensis TaxID=67331 RepID=UPI0033A37113